MLREDIYYAAYQKLYANKGAATKGSDNDTADGFSEQYVQRLIQELRDGSYRAKPVRREYIEKRNGKKWPLGIPSFRDKLLQEAVRMILEAIYEPAFDNRSHGFRPNRSCHTALRQIASDFTGVIWFIEGDIKGCFDSIDHETLIAILGRKIKDSKLDEISKRFTQPRSALRAPEYNAVSKEMKKLSYWIDHTSNKTEREELGSVHTIGLCYNTRMKLEKEQYEQIKECFPKQRKPGKISNLDVLKAVLYIVENGCKWRVLPKE